MTGNLPFSGSRFGKWVGRRLVHPLSPRMGDYVFQAPPFQQHQSVRNRKTGSRIAYRVRNKNDLSIANQMFVAEEYAIDSFKRAEDVRAEYRAILKSGKKPLILDCGGNIGLAALYLRDQFPEALIVSVEPDPSNFDLLKENVAHPNMIAVHAAVGSVAGRGRMVDPGHGHCGMRVEIDPAGEIVFASIDSLIAEHGDGAIPFMLKMDIEGFESEVFSGSTDWLDRFYIAAIELHDWMLPGAASSRPFVKAVAALDRDFLFRGENVFSISNRPSRAAG